MSINVSGSFGDKYSFDTSKKLKEFDVSSKNDDFSIGNSLSKSLGGIGKADKSMFDLPTVGVDFKGESIGDLLKGKEDKDIEDKTVSELLGKSKESDSDISSKSIDKSELGPLLKELLGDKDLSVGEKEELKSKGESELEGGDLGSLVKALIGLLNKLDLGKLGGDKTEQSNPQQKAPQQQQANNAPQGPAPAQPAPAAPPAAPPAPAAAQPAAVPPQPAPPAAAPVAPNPASQKLRETMLRQRGITPQPEYYHGGMPPNTPIAKPVAQPANPTPQQVAAKPAETATANSTAPVAPTPAATSSAQSSSVSGENNKVDQKTNTNNFFINNLKIDTSKNLAGEGNVMISQESLGAPDLSKIANNTTPTPPPAAPVPPAPAVATPPAAPTPAPPPAATAPAPAPVPPPAVVKPPVPPKPPIA